MKVLLVNGVLTVLLLLLVEGGVRVAVPEIVPAGTDRRLFADSVYGAVPGPRAGAVGTSNGARFEVGPEGFWKYSSAREDTARAAWLLLGDSVTMGIGVEPDSTFAGRLAARVDSLRVLNPSLIGYSSRDYLALLDALTGPASPYRIERVTVFWCLNDVYAAVPGLSDPDATLRRVGGAALTFLRRHVHTYHFLKAALFDRPRTYFEHDRRLYAGAPLEAALEDLRRMHALAAERGVRLEVALLPYEYQLRTGTPDVFSPQDTLREALEGVRVWDAAPYLAERGPSEELYLYGDGIHLSERGHALVARFVETNGR